MTRARRARGWSRVDALLAVALGLFCVGVLVPAVQAPARRQEARAECSARLRQVGLAAIQYSDHQRFFPHVGPKIGQPQGGIETNHGPRVMRALVYTGTLEVDAVGAFVCPASADRALPVSDAARAERRRWSWGGKDPGADARSPLAVEETDDPTLLETTELSYGWSRRGMNSCVRSTALLAADRACRGTPNPEDLPGLRGNHEGGLNVVQADGMTAWIDASAPGVDRLTDLEAPPGLTAGALGIAPAHREDR